MDNNLNEKIVPAFNIGIFDPKGINLNPFNNAPYSETYLENAPFWSSLPCYERGEEIVNSVLKNDCILIQAATGAGKSVLIPKFALHANNYSGKIIMTLPKKIITKNSAQYSAKTMDVMLGNEIGYQFRGESVKNENTILLYSTDGSIIQMLNADPLLQSVDILIIDEAHERKIQIDLLLYLLKNAIIERKKRNLKKLTLIIMSATIDEKLFSNYFKDVLFDSFSLAGKTNYPIKSVYLDEPLDKKSPTYVKEGSAIIVNIIKSINENKKGYPEGDFIFFVCSSSECKKIAIDLEKKLPDTFVMALFSGYNKNNEIFVSDPNAFKTINSSYKRRIFVATNVAESSITIDGIVWVIDSGLEIEVKYDPVKSMDIMKKHFITQAQIMQRKGRAGRTKGGHAYHLYTKEEEEKTSKYPEPEILKANLRETCIQLMKIGSKLNHMDYNVESTIKMFTDFIEPPLEKYIVNGFDFNIAVNTINSETMTLSNLGNLILKSKFSVVDGLCLAYAFNSGTHVFSICLKIICIVSMLKKGIDEIFSSKINKEEKKRIISRAKNNSLNSEHLLLYNIYQYNKSNPDERNFNNNLCNIIESLYVMNIDKMLKLFSSFNILIDDDHFVQNDETEEENIDMYKYVVKALNYGLKTNTATKINKSFIYSEETCDLSKCVLKFDDFENIVFSSNLYMNGKLTIKICTPVSQ